MGSRARLPPLSALTHTETPTHFPRKMEIYGRGCAVSPLKRGKCRSATSLQLLVVKEDMETDPVTDVLGEEKEEGWGQMKR